jgi:hypothetical protein
MRSFLSALSALVLCAASALPLAQRSLSLPIQFRGFLTSRRSSTASINDQRTRPTAAPMASRWVDAGFWRWRVIALKELA